MREEVAAKRDSESVCIREVWADNLDEEFEAIRDIVDRYPYVAMDTEFPGVVIRPPPAVAEGGRLKCVAEHNYETLKANVDALHLIQLGLTFSDADGKLPRCPRTGRRCVWQFNFNEFDPARDPHAWESIELLKKSGMDLEKNRERGIPSQRFGEHVMSSGIVLNENVRWIAFHGAYDFGYLLKVLTGREMPRSRQGFMRAMRTYFPWVYDVKHMMRYWDLYGGLSRVAGVLEVERIGVCHQAASDSLLTSSVFFKLIRLRRPRSLPHNALPHPYEYAGVLYGL